MIKQKHIFITKDCVKSYELGKKQGALEAYDNIVKCLKSENQRFKEKRNPFLPNFELEQYSREQINEIKLIIKELKEKEGVLKENE